MDDEQERSLAVLLFDNSVLIRRAELGPAIPWFRPAAGVCSAPVTALPFARADARRQSLRGCGRSVGERERRSGWRGGVVGRRRVNAGLLARPGTSHGSVRRGARRGARKRERPLICATRLSPRPSAARATIARNDSEGGILGGSRWARPAWTTGGSGSCGRRVAVRPPARGTSTRARRASRRAPRNTPTGHREAEPGSSAFDER
jgi:hypothetical protein